MEENYMRVKERDRGTEQRTQEGRGKEWVSEKGRKKEEITKYWQEWRRKTEKSNSTFDTIIPKGQEVNLKVLLIGHIRKLWTAKQILWLN